MNLSSSVGEIPHIGPSYQKKLAKINIYSIEDLLYHTPNRFLDFRDHVSISDARQSQSVTVKGIVKSKTSIYSKSGKKVQIINIDDGTGSMSLVFFNQIYLLKTFVIGQTVYAAGEVSWFSRKLAMFAPEYESENQEIHTGRLVPVYPTTSGITSKWLRARIGYVFPKIKDGIVDFMQDNEIERFNTIKLDRALKLAHFPTSHDDYKKAISRFSLNEMVYLDAIMSDKKRVWKSKKTYYKLKCTSEIIKDFEKLLSFNLTSAQRRSIEEISHDLKGNFPMNRLLLGDVGSGKTVVAAFALYASHINGHKSIIMAPTQIVAKQHFDSLKHLFKNSNIKVGLITSSSKPKSVSQIDVLVGTHSLMFQKILSDISVVVIDEQHRFGVKQRMKLTDLVTHGKFIPNLLTMTATPIPRTIALSIFGNLDLSYLDVLPSGRQDVTTWIVPESKRGGSYNWISDKITKDKDQVYIVCPLIDDSDTLSSSKAVTSEYKRLSKIFTSHRLGLLHGRMKSVDKDNILKKFRAGDIDILVSTPVIEVGVDVPNATIMVVESADRFGLAQLHQLRGRVGRGEKKSYCLLYTESTDSNTIKRLESLRSIKSGFELSEADLALRGPGEFFGSQQHGFLKLQFADIANTKQLQIAHEIVKTIQNDKKRFSSLISIAIEKVGSA